jgi:hypothetical protein
MYLLYDDSAVPRASNVPFILDQMSSSTALSKRHQKFAAMVRDDSISAFDKVKAWVSSPSLHVHTSAKK